MGIRLGEGGKRHSNCCITIWKQKVLLSWCFSRLKGRRFSCFSFRQVLFLLEMMKLPWNVLNLWFTWQRTNLIMSVLKNQNYLHYHQKKGQKCFPGCVLLTLIFLCSWKHIFVFKAKLHTFPCLLNGVFGSSFCLDYSVYGSSWSSVLHSVVFFISLSICLGIPVSLFKQLFSTCTSGHLFVQSINQSINQSKTFIYPQIYRVALNSANICRSSSLLHL